MNQQPTRDHAQQTIADAIAHTRQLSRSAVRRCFVRDLIGLSGPALTVAFAGSLIGIGVDRLIGPGIPWWMIAGPAGALGLASAFGLAWYRRTNALEAASEVDRAMALEDRLSSALDLADKKPDDPFVQMAVAEAERLATRVRARQAIVIRLGRSWLAWPVLAMATAGIGIFVQPLDLLRSEEQTVAEQERQSRIEQAANRLREIQQALETPTDPDNPDSEENDSSADLLAPDQREYLEQLQNQVEAGEIAPEQAEAELARMLEEAANEREQRARDALANDEALRNLLKDISPESGNGNEASSAQTVQELRDALRSGELDRAADALDDLMDLAERSEAAERERIAQELEQLSDELNQLAERENQLRERQQRAEQEELSRRGLNGDDAERFAQQEQRQSREEIAEQLREQGFNPERADDLARRIEEHQRQNQASRNAEQTAEQLRDAMRDSANESRSDPGDQQTPPSTDQGSESQGSQSGEQSGESGSQQQDPSSEESSDSGSDPQQSGDRQAGQQAGEQSGQSEQTEGGEPCEEGGGSDSKSGNQPGSGAPSDAAPGSEGGQQQGEQSGEGASTRAETQENGQSQQEGAGESGRPAQQEQQGGSGSGQESQSDANAPEGAGGQSDRSGEQPGAQEAAGDGQTSSDSPTGSGSDSQSGQPGGQQPAGQGNDAPEGTEAGGGEGGDGQATPTGQEANDPSSSSSGGTQAGEGDAQRRSPSDILRDRQNNSRQAENDASAAERLREQHRRLLEDETTASELDRRRQQAERDRRESGRQTEEVDVRRRAERAGEERVVGQQESDGTRPTTSDRPRQSPGDLEADLIQRREQLNRDLEENRISQRYWETVSRYFDKSIERQRRLRESGDSGGSTGTGASE